MPIEKERDAKTVGGNGGDVSVLRLRLLFAANSQTRHLAKGKQVNIPVPGRGLKYNGNMQVSSLGDSLAKGPKRVFFSF